MKRKPTCKPSKTSDNDKTETEAPSPRDLEDGEGPDMSENTAFWASVKPFKALVTKAQLTIRLNQDVVDRFRGLGRGYQIQINAALRSYINHAPAK